MKPLSHFKFIGSFVGLFILFLVVALISTANADVTGTRAKTISSTPTDVVIAALGTQPSNEYVSPVYTADFTFNGVGLSWSGNASDVDFWLKVDNENWEEAEMVGDETKDQAENHISQPAFINGSTVQYKITGHDVTQVQNVRITYFDSTVPPSTSTLRSLATSVQRSIQASVNSLNITSRSDWGADESWRHWDPQYATPTKFVVHHTAGGDGGADPTATIRGIYYWQSTVLGWGDIGYNYLIDPAGHIYEGRYGGENNGQSVIGAHAYNSMTDTNFNVGSIGIVLLGCYEDTTGACNKVNTVTPEMTKALTSLIANKAAQFGINPNGDSDWHDVHTDNVIGHRDIDSTFCPGNTVESLLTTVRTLASTEYSTLSLAQKNYKATWSYTDLATHYTSSDTPTITIDYTNTGLKPWPADKVHLQISVQGKRIKQQVTLPHDVNAGELISIPVTWTELPQQSNDFTIMMKLYYDGKVIAGSRHNHAVTINNPYQAKIINNTIPLAIKQGWSPTVQLVVENNGTIDWDENTTIQVNNTKVGQLKKPLNIGEERSFSFVLPTGDIQAIGSQPMVIRLMHADHPIPGSRLMTTVRIDK